MVSRAQVVKSGPQNLKFRSKIFGIVNKYQVLQWFILYVNVSVFEEYLWIMWADFAMAINNETKVEWCLIWLKKHWITATQTIPSKSIPVLQNIDIFEHQHFLPNKLEKLSPWRFIIYLLKGRRINIYGPQFKQKLNEIIF